MDNTIYDKYDKESHRHYRNLGNGCREYAPDYVFSSGYNTPEKPFVSMEKARKTGKYCPFKNGIITECFTDCIFYDHNSCAFALDGKKPDKETRGENCPVIKRLCNEECAFYKNGCGLLKIVDTIKERT